MSTIYVTATPIGNLEDITLRALRILKEVDVILCEDTRVTKKLLSHYGINKPLLSYHANSKLSKTDKIFDLIEQGKDLALVSDAGTPTISDPGSRLIKEVREKFNDVSIVSVPGPSALISALSISGVLGREFVFLGFLPHKKGRKTIFEYIEKEEKIVVFYESTHRIMKTLEALKGNLKKITICREMTKMHEEVLYGTPCEILEILTNEPVRQKGEFVVIVGN